MLRAPAGRDPEAGIPQPALQFTREGATNFARQKFAGGGDHTAAWTDVARPDGSRLILASVGFNPQSEGDAGKQEATDQLKQAQSTGLEQLTTTHRQWWHGFYPASFLSIPDTRLESFYWIQLYKMASATRADRPMLDLMGPWFRTSPWLRCWFKAGEREYNLELRKGQSVVLTSTGAKVALTLAPVRSEKDRENFYGLNERTPGKP
jgi:hypothetical protein